MSALHFTKKLFASPELAQVSFDVAVLERYLAQSGTKITRTRSVGRIKTASWSLDFGIAPDEKTIHVPAVALGQKLPESEREHWAQHAEGARFSQNFLKMQTSRGCFDDGDLRAWGEPEEESFF